MPLVAERLPTMSRHSPDKGGRWGLQCQQMGPGQAASLEFEFIRSSFNGVFPGYQFWLCEC